MTACMEPVTDPRQLLRGLGTRPRPTDETTQTTSGEEPTSHVTADGKYRITNSSGQWFVKSITTPARWEVGGRAYLGPFATRQEANDELQRARSTV